MASTTDTLSTTSTEASLKPTSLASMTQFNIYYTASKLNATLHIGDKSSPAVYYGQSKILKTKPMFYIRDRNENGQVLSFAQIPWVHKNMSIGLGDGSESDWETLSRDKNLCHRSDYHFTFQNIEYDWIKDKGKKIATAYECLDKDGNVFATFLSGGMCNWSKGGELSIRSGIEKDLEYLILASALGIWSMEALNYQSILKAY